MAVHDTGGGGGRGGGSPALNSGLQGKFQRESWAGSGKQPLVFIQ